jgi:hypothetical protein
MSSNGLQVQSTDTHFENILAFYLDDKRSDEDKLKHLSEIERDMKNRWETAWISMLEFRSREDCVKKLVQLFGVSKATAYRDVQRTEMLFGSFKKFDKEAQRYIQIERKHKLLQLALKDKNLELAHKIDTQIDKLLGLDKEDSPVNLEKLQSQDYEMVMSKKQEKLIRMIFKNGQSNVNMNVDAVEVDFEDLRPEDEA